MANAVEEADVAAFSLTDLIFLSPIWATDPAVVEAALRGPVEITRRGKRKFMLLTAEDYDRSVKAANTTRAPHAGEAPEGSRAKAASTQGD